MSLIGISIPNDIIKLIMAAIRSTKEYTLFSFEEETECDIVLIVTKLHPEDAANVSILSRIKLYINYNLIGTFIAFAGKVKESEKYTTIENKGGESVIVFSNASFKTYMIKIAECLENIFDKKFIFVKETARGIWTIETTIYFSDGKYIDIAAEVKSANVEKSAILRDYFCGAANIFNKGEERTKKIFEKTSGERLYERLEKNAAYFIIGS